MMKLLQQYKYFKEPKQYKVYSGDIFEILKWKNIGFNINEKYLNNLRFD